MATSPTGPRQGWPDVPSPHVSPTQRAETARRDLLARRRVVVSPRSAALVQHAGARQGGKFKPIGPLQSGYAPQLKPADQSQRMPAPGPSPKGNGKWKGKPLPASRRKGSHAAGAKASHKRPAGHSLA